MKKLWTHPVKSIPAAFLTVIAVGTVLLMLPVCHNSGSPDLLKSLFMAVSSVCVTGLTTVDISTYYSRTGQAVIIALMQIGGFGIMAATMLLGLMISRKLHLSERMVAQADTHLMRLGDAKSSLKRIALIMLSVETVVALITGLRWWAGHGIPLPQAMWHGLFHAVAAYTHASMSTHSTSLMAYASDPLICLPICAAIVIGSIGFPVLFELRHAWSTPRTWTVHTQLTIYGTITLLAIGIAAFTLSEWSNPETLGKLDPSGRVVAGITGGVTPRTSGFSVVDYAHITKETLVVLLVLMFIGGGAASTAGGIKVTTFFVLGAAILAEVRGDPDVTIGRRRIPTRTIRQAITVALLSVGAVTLGTIALVLLTHDESLDALAFEAVSAFATVGLSTGITPNLPPAAQVVLMALMFVGRVGTVTAISAIAVRNRPRRYRLPEEAPIVG